MNRAYYAAPIHVFLYDDPLAIIGRLAEQHQFELEDLQKSAWRAEIDLLKQTLVSKVGYIFFEFSIPRMGKRVDVILLINGIVFVLEFKIGESGFPSYALEQVMDYALDLKNFHQTSHDRPIVPVLVSTKAQGPISPLNAHPDGVYEPQKTNALQLSECLRTCLETIHADPIDPIAWQAGGYKPTPTIIEAAQALYRGHNVRDISRSDAGAKNLSETSDAIDRIIDDAREQQKKAICFITGVPGAGKTLAGLNIANRRLQLGLDEHSVFLSGNGPLVTVLREALVRDEMTKDEKRGKATRSAQAFIQNIHHFRDEYAGNNSIPPDHVVVFDEAQRAWTREATAKFMKRKRGLYDFSMSEPEFLISAMDRHPDWAVIVCLIGGGQEIHTGEAGLLEWFQALRNHFPKWEVYLSGQITDTEYLKGQQPATVLPEHRLFIDDSLHLAVSNRSFRSEKVSTLVKSVLDLDQSRASILYSEVYGQYPIYLTREMHLARDWLRSQARGSERYGLLASSGAIRLRPEGIFVKAKIEVEHWFLDDRNDVRSSYVLEGVATEFDIQGLELDWTAIAWDADLRHNGKDWEFWSFEGSKWQKVREQTRQEYLVNSYRVLLTRARQGMIIFIPRGDDQDPTRPPSYYDHTFNYLRRIGIPVI
jgi:hypothetical protein